MSFVRVGAFALGVILTPFAASAVSLDAQTLMNTAVAISLGDFTTVNTAHVEGPTYIGGSVASGTFDVNTDGLPSINVGGITGGLIVGGDMTAHANTIIGGAQVGGTFTDTNSGASSSAVITDHVDGIPVAAMTSLFTDLSGELSSLSTTLGASITGDMNNISVVSGAGVDGIAVLNLDATTAASYFTTNALMNFSIDDDTTLIINVAGNFDTSYVTAKVNTDQPNVLFNFYEATTVTFGSQAWNASVLAPLATVSTPQGGVNGTVVAGEIRLGGEIRPYNNSNGFAGDLPTATPPVVPLPASFVLLGSAGLALGAMRRRRR
ncbi:collagen-binding domain-containing protein [Tropicimonas sp. IMCC34043]|uniref:collagen-binding domain-containing protein n=1 Tax=Tropicimonas sp. IMCC34043 TaxID=2248760 RepID=UPI001E49E5E3|nr:collagen-binding domain-containing protein [Tropicimonas sp. IMCC34043]